MTDAKRSNLVIASTVSRISAMFLLLAGLALLFASDSLLPALVPGFPSGAAWLGQLLAAGWLAIAALNWLNRFTLLGGIYGRPVVLTNVAVYFISALSMLRALVGHEAPAVAWGLLVPFALMAAVYGLLMLRGPFDS